MICVLGTFHPFKSTTNWPSSLSASSSFDLWKVIRTHLKLSKSFNEIDECSTVTPLHKFTAQASDKMLQRTVLFLQCTGSKSFPMIELQVLTYSLIRTGEWPFNLNKLFLSKRSWIQKWEPKIYSGDLMLFLFSSNNKLNKCPWSLSTFTSLFSSLVTMWLCDCKFRKGQIYLTQSE